MEQAKRYMRSFGESLGVISPSRRAAAEWPTPYRAGGMAIPKETYGPLRLPPPRYMHMHMYMCMHMHMHMHMHTCTCSIPPVVMRE